MNPSKVTTVKVSAIKVYSALRDLEDRFNAIGAHDEAAKIREQKIAVLRNIGEVADKTTKGTPVPGTILARSAPVIDWNGF